MRVTPLKAWPAGLHIVKSAASWNPTLVRFISLSSLIHHAYGAFRD
jgi:hypothetical protein